MGGMRKQSDRAVLASLIGIAALVQCAKGKGRPKAALFKPCDPAISRSTRPGQGWLQQASCRR